jgi:hypothetical protein
MENLKKNNALIAKKEGFMRMSVTDVREDLKKYFRNFIPFFAALLLSLPAHAYCGMTWDGKDPYHQPAPTTDYYGSGDVFLDGIIDDKDLTAIQNMAKPTTDADYQPPNYRADVDGDGQVTGADYTIVQQYLNHYRTYLPGWWNYLPTRGEREAWARQMITKIHYKYYIHMYTSPWYECFAFSAQMCDIGVFYRKPDFFGQQMYNVGKTLFNLPIYEVGYSTGGGHSANCILVGDDPLVLSNWMFLDGQSNMDYPILPDWPAYSIGGILTFVDKNSPPTYVNENLLKSRPSLIDQQSDNSVDLWFPHFIPGTQQLLFERQREDMSKIHDIHLGNFPLNIQGAGQPLVNENTISYLMDCYKVPSGNEVHLLWKSKPPLTSGGNDKTPGLFYGRLAAGVLQDITRVSSGTRWPRNARVLSTPSGDIHVFWSDKGNLDQGNASLYWRKKSSTGWDPSEQILTSAWIYGDASDLSSKDDQKDFISAAVDPSGVVILIYMSDDFKLYEKYYDGSVWSSGTVIDQSLAKGGVLFRTSDGTLHVVYLVMPSENPGYKVWYNLVHRKKTSLSSSWSSPELIATYASHDGQQIVPNFPTEVEGQNNSLYIGWENQLYTSVLEGNGPPVDRSIGFNVCQNGVWGSAAEIPKVNTRACSYPTISVDQNNNPIFAWQYTQDETQSIECKRILYVPQSGDLQQTVLAAQQGDVVVVNQDFAPASMTVINSIAHSNGQVVFTKTVDLSSVAAQLANVVIIRETLKSGETVGRVRMFCSRIEDAVNNVRDNETIEVFPGNYTISSPGELNPRDIYVPSGTTVHQPNPFYVVGGGINNTHMIIHSGAVIGFAPTCARGIYLNQTGRIQLESGVTLNPSIQVVGAPKAVGITSPVIGFFASIGGAADASQPGTTILLGAIGTRPPYDGGPFVLNDQSLVGVLGSTRETSTIIRVGNATVLPVSFPNDFGILMQNLQFEVNVPEATFYTNIFHFSSASSTNSEFKNVIMVNTNEAKPKMMRALEVDYTAGTLKITNCLFKNFFIGIDVVKPADQPNAPLIDATIFEGNMAGAHCFDGAGSLSKITNSDFWNNDCDLRIGRDCYSGAANVNPITAASNKFVDPLHVDEAMLDFRLVLPTSPGSPLIDAHTDGYTDIGPFQVNTVCRMSPFINTRVILSTGDTLRVINGELQPHSMGNAVELQKNIGPSLRPTYELILKPNLIKKAFRVDVFPRADVDCPALPPDYKILDMSINKYEFGNFRFADMPRPGDSVGNTFTPDNIHPNAVRNVTATFTGSTVVLRWDKSPEPDVRAYKIYVSKTTPLDVSTAQQISSVPGDTTSYTDSQADGTAFYGIVAYDTTGNQAPMSTVSPLYNFSVHSSGGTTINQDVSIDGGVGSNASVAIGDRSIVNGNITSCSDAFLHDRTCINGNVSANGTVAKYGTPTVTGTITNGAANPPLPIQARTVTPGTQNITVAASTTMTLTPGSYNNFMALTNSKIFLKPGTYNFRTFKTEPDVKIQYDISGSDAIQINVLESFEPRDRTVMDFTSVIWRDPHSVQIYTSQPTAVDIHPYDDVSAIIFAPNAQIHIHPYVMYAGALYGKTVLVDPYAVLKIKKETNLALNRPALDCGHEGNLLPQYAFDGKSNTRW